MAIVDWRVTPGIAVDDPLLMVGMPPALTAATGMDALTHAVEAYVSTIATPMTDSAAEKAIELIAKHLRPAVANGQDIVAREGMCFAQYLAGMAFNNASLGHVHAMAHQLGGFYDLPHGECNAILLPHVSKFNLIAKMDRFVKIAELMGENTSGLAPRDAAELALVAIRKLSADIGIPAGLIELGKRYGKEVKASRISTPCRQRPEGCLRPDQPALPQGCGRQGDLHRGPVTRQFINPVQPAPCSPSPGLNRLHRVSEHDEIRCGWRCGAGSRPAFHVPPERRCRGLSSFVTLHLQSNSNQNLPNRTSVGKKKIEEKLNGTIKFFVSICPI
jgi:hypothetical protein